MSPDVGNQEREREMMMELQVSSLFILFLNFITLVVEMTLESQISVCL